ncbi:MAG: 1-deoxy-D-xylulose 5-phosphate reductoisomerase [Bacteroides sp. SM1_62]|nr:MAG: 1-deoxy-D-xylulose 5-phosphate reductoisomerase [Bacteroides sp. SM23_62]KPL22946.1 MAG: 1-deoxy-D-xylulose 5-phosphate reductoisomerase [Bacteroides sp. SM1_62]
MHKHVAILGSTGSIGTQTLEVIDKNPDHFKLEILTARNNADVLIAQSRKFLPNHVVIANEDKYDYVSQKLSDLPVKVYAGVDALEQIVEMDSVDIIMSALVGFSGLRPTLRAIRAGKDIALANKETLVVGGELVTKSAIENSVNIYPVDSEHSAIFQCIVGEEMNPIEKVILTASGGPFLGKDQAYLKKVTRDEALQHPNWCMGDKVTIDSASLMNKGLEVIEAKWLFGLKPEQIEVIIHPQSVIHSLVQFEDGSLKAQLGIPDMKLPIQYALGFPKRLRSDLERFSFSEYPNLTFHAPDLEIFPNLTLAYRALEIGGNMPCVMNAANEVAVNAFLEGRLDFFDMPGVIEETMNSVAYIATPDLNDYVETDSEARKIAGSYLL